MKTYDKFYINGEWVAPIGESGTFTLVNPATEAPFATLALGSSQDVDRAVRAAKTAFTTFSATGKEARIALLQRIVEVFARREDDLMAAASEEMGAPLANVAHARAGLEGFKNAIDTLRAYAFETRLASNIVRREPIGVCGLITPWNWPIQLVANKVSMALAAGCTMVLKPSEYTPVCTLVLAEILHEAGVPKGVFNLVNGDGPTVGHAISAHPDIDMVSFTGSTRAGVLVAQTAAETVKRVCQELGGKSANIVLPDADLRAAAQWNVTRGCSNTGQSCHAPSRILVHESQAATLLDFLAQAANSIVVGDPRDPATQIGPVVNRTQFERIQGYIQKGMDEGARVVAGGLGRPAGLERGFYVKPTVFADVRPGMTIEQEEIFGPVLSVITYRTEEDAIAIANGTAYGLGGYVFSSNRDKALDIGKRMRAGRIFYNGAPANPVAPMGGYKQSGNGRESGVFGLEEYLEVKAMLGFL